MIPEIMQELVYRGLYLLVKQLYLFVPTTPSKDWGSSASKMGISLIKCWFYGNEEDLAILCNTSVVCWWNHWVLCVSLVCHLNSSTTDSMKLNGSCWGTAGLHKHEEMQVSHKGSVSDMCCYLTTVAYQS